MRYLALSLVLLITVIDSAHAQSSLNLYKVNFNSDESVLDNEDLLTLRKITALYKAAPYAEISLYAHTDNDAGDDYNLALSKRRALSVKQYLVKQGVDPSRISWQRFGESKPLKPNENESAKAENRRVEIRMETHRFRDVNHVLKAAGGNCKQTFTINPTKETTIKGKNGSTVSIPANSLVDAKGHTITKPVEIHLSEFLNPADALFQSLSTQTTDGEQLETGGMLKVEATSANQPVMIRKGSQVQVQIPTAQVRPDMELFNGRVNATGVMEWEATGKPFGSPFKVARLEETDMREMSFYFKVPPPPPRPYIGSRPELMRYQSQWDYLSFWEYITLSAASRKEKMQLHHEQIDVMNKNRTDQYIRKVSEYKVRYAKYQADSLIYVKKYSDSFEKWLDKQTRIQQAFLLSLKPAYTDTIAFSNLVIFGADNKILSRSEMMYFKKNYHHNNYRHLADKHSHILTALELMKTQGIVGAYNHFGYTDLITCFTNIRGKRSGQDPMPLTPDMGVITTAHASSVEEMAIARAVNASMTAQETAAIEQEITYSAYISSFGTINCDRFTKTPPDMFVNVHIPLKGQAQVAFYLPSQKSFLYASGTKDGYYVRIPKNTAYTVFVMSLQGQQPLFYTEKGKAEKGIEINPDLQRVTLAYLREEFYRL